MDEHINVLIDQPAKQGVAHRFYTSGCICKHDDQGPASRSVSHADIAKWRKTSPLGSILSS